MKAPAVVLPGLIPKKSTYIQFFPPPHRHYRMTSRRLDAGSFSIVQVAHERFAMGSTGPGLRVAFSAGQRRIVSAVGARFPKLLNYSAQLQVIEDPFHLGANVTLMLAIFAEVLCPLLIIAGVLVRLACLPILCVLLIALLVVHPQWSLDEGQFGWLLLILFTSLFIAGPGRLALNVRFAGALRYA